MGFTQETLAESLRLDRSTVARWEQGTVRPHAVIRPGIARALNLTPDELNALLDLEPPATHSAELQTPPSVVNALIESIRSPLNPTSVVNAPWTVAGALVVLHQVAGGPPDRREFLTITSGAVSGLAGQWTSALATAALPMAPDTVPDGRLNDEVLDRLEHRLAELHRLDDTLGGRDLCELAVAEFRYLTYLADHATYGAAAGQRLFSLITDAACLCGWLYCDSARDNTSRYYLVAALRTSAVANDQLAGMHVLGRLSEVSDPQEALKILETAGKQAQHSGGSPRFNSLLACRNARAYARVGYLKACQYALSDAERALEKACPESDEDPGWLYYHDESNLHQLAAACWVDLGQPQRARPHIDAALRYKKANMVRDMGVCYALSAEAHLGVNELEPACDELRAAADIAGRTGSIRLWQRIDTIRRTMSTYDNEPRVAELDRYLAGLTI